MKRIHMKLLTAAFTLLMAMLILPKVSYADWSPGMDPYPIDNLWNKGEDSKTRFGEGMAYNLQSGCGECLEESFTLQTAWEGDPDGMELDRDLYEYKLTKISSSDPSVVAEKVYNEDRYIEGVKAGRAEITLEYTLNLPNGSTYKLENHFTVIVDGVLSYFTIGCGANAYGVSDYYARYDFLMNTPLRMYIHPNFNYSYQDTKLTFKARAYYDDWDEEPPTLEYKYGTDETGDYLDVTYVSDNMDVSGYTGVLVIDAYADGQLVGSASEMLYYTAMRDHWNLDWSGDGKYVRENTDDIYVNELAKGQSFTIRPVYGVYRSDDPDYFYVPTATSEEEAGEDGDYSRVCFKDDWDYSSDYDSSEVSVKDNGDGSYTITRLTNDYTDIKFHTHSRITYGRYGHGDRMLRLTLNTFYCDHNWVTTKESDTDGDGQIDTIEEICSICDDTRERPVTQGRCGDNLTWRYYGTEDYSQYKTLVIEGSGAMYDYEEGKAPWSNLDVCHLILSEGITRIGNYAFDGQEDLDASFPSTLESIGTAAFRGSFGVGRGDAYNTLLLPDGLKTIEADAFRNSGVWGAIVFPESLTSIGNNAFRGATKLKCISLSKTVPSLGSNVFTDCSFIAFYPASAASWKDVNMGSSVKKESYDDKLYTCAGIISNTVRWYLNSQGTLVIQGSGPMAYNWRQGDFDVAKYGQLDPVRDKIKNIQIEEGITEIAAGAFYKCENLESVSIADTVTSIGLYAFSGCKNLKSFTYPKGITTANMTLFDYVYEMDQLIMCTEEVVMPDNISVIGSFFSGAGLKKLTVMNPNAKFNIGDDGFYDKTDGVRYPTVIVGYSGSTAEAFAEKFGYKFEALEDEPVHTHTWKAASYIAPKTCTECGATEGKPKSLSKPVISSLTNSSSKGIVVKWGKITGATGYYVYRGTSKIKTITSGKTVSYTDASANTNGTKYEYKIVAIAANSAGKVVNKSSASAVKKTYRLTKPAISSAKNVAARKITLTWGKNSKVTGYQVQYVTGTTTKTVSVSSYKTVTKTLSSLTKGKTYTLKVRAYKTVSGVKYYSAWSAGKSVKVAK